MYMPPAFSVSDIQLCYQLIENYSFATLIAIPEMEISHLPLFLHKENDKYIIRGHMAKANPLVHQFENTVDVLCIFNGPHGYISPTYYQSDALNVPTWNYAVVHVKGRGRLTNKDSLINTLDFSVHKFESLRDTPWSIDWKNELATKKLNGIVGFEIEITDIQGKFKLSQNRTLDEQSNVVNGLTQSNNHDDNALAIFMQQVTNG